MDFVDRNAARQCLCDSEHAKRRRGLQLLTSSFEPECVAVQTIDAYVEHSHRLLNYLRKAATDGHHLADAFHFAADLHRSALKFR